MSSMANNLMEAQTEILFEKSLSLIKGPNTSESSPLHITTINHAESVLEHTDDLNIIHLFYENKTKFYFLFYVFFYESTFLDSICDFQNKKCSVLEVGNMNGNFISLNKYEDCQENNNLTWIHLEIFIITKFCPKIALKKLKLISDSLFDFWATKASAWNLGINCFSFDFTISNYNESLCEILSSTLNQQSLTLL